MILAYFSTLGLVCSSGFAKQRAGDKCWIQGVFLRPTTEGEANILEIVVTEAADLGGHTIMFASSVGSTCQGNCGYWIPVLRGAMEKLKLLSSLGVVPSSGLTFWQTAHSGR